ncbi:MAG: BTAD domain-containing putative transcriptional regulator [Rubrobacteraceae bacterium]
MDTSVERDHSVQRSNGEGGASGDRDVPIGISLWVPSALDDRATMVESPENVSAVPRQSRDHSPSGSVAWRMGYDFIERCEYGRAAECFGRMLLSAEGSADRLSAEAAGVAAQLCAKLSREQLVGEKIRDALRALSQNPSRLSYEEVNHARAALAGCAEDGLPVAYHASPGCMAGEVTGATVGRVSTPARAIATGAVAAGPCLWVRFFGRFELLRDGGEAVCLDRNARALAILKYLLARRCERPVSQDHLMGWLWPESNPKRARWSLNSAVYALRKFLGGCLPSLPASETILFQGGGYRLSPRILLSTDVEEFYSRYEEGHQLEDAGRVSEAVSQYEKAAELYRGDYLTEDLYEEWTMIERERLLDAYAELLRRLAIRYAEVGQPWESVKTYYQILERDRCDEYTHRLLMECYVRLGQRARALRQYRLCERALRSEYDMMPSPKTRTLYASILKDGGSR